MAGTTVRVAGRRVELRPGRPRYAALEVAGGRVRVAYSPDQARDERGRFGEGSGDGETRIIAAGPVIKLDGLAGDAQATGTLDAFKTIHEAARGYDEPGSVADALDRDVSERQVADASERIAEASRQALERDGYPERFTVYRQVRDEQSSRGPEGGVVSVSTRPLDTFSRAEPFTVRRDDVLTYGEALQRGTFLEQELQVDSAALVPGRAAGVRLAYSPDQERDERGRFGEGGGDKADEPAGRDPVAGPSSLEDRLARYGSTPAEWQASLEQILPGAHVRMYGSGDGTGLTEGKPGEFGGRPAGTETVTAIIEAFDHLAAEHPEVAGALTTVALDGYRVGAGEYANFALESNRIALDAAGITRGGGQPLGAERYGEGQPQAERAYAITVHEFGHAVDAAAAPPTEKQLERAYTTGRSAAAYGSVDKFLDGPRTPPETLSPYSATNKAEYFAEAFAATTLGLTDRISDADRAMVAQASAAAAANLAGRQAAVPDGEDEDRATIYDTFDGSIVWDYGQSTARRAYSPDQARDERGRFGEGGAGGDKVDEPADSTSIAAAGAALAAIGASHDDWGVLTETWGATTLDQEQLNRRMEAAVEALDRAGIDGLGAMQAVVGWSQAWGVDQWRAVAGSEREPAPLESRSDRVPVDQETHKVISDMLELGRRTEIDEPLYRAIALSDTFRDMLSAGELGPGTVIDNRGVSSWSRDEGVASRFGGFTRDTAMLEVRGAHGIDAAALVDQGFAWQREVMAVDPAYRVVSVTEPADRQAPEAPGSILRVVVEPVTADELAGATAAPSPAELERLSAAWFGETFGQASVRLGHPSPDAPGTGDPGTGYPVPRAVVRVAGGRVRIAYSPDQERDDRGRFGHGGDGQAGRGDLPGPSPLADRLERYGSTPDEWKAAVERILPDRFAHADTRGLTAGFDRPEGKPWDWVAPSTAAAVTAEIEALEQLVDRYPGVAAGLTWVGLGETKWGTGLGEFTTTRGYDPKFEPTPSGAIWFDSARIGELAEGPDAVPRAYAGADPSRLGYAVAVHEFGHALDYMATRPSATDVGRAFRGEQPRQALLDQGSATYAARAAGPSEYAGRNAQEYFAEAFAASQLGYGDRLTDADRAMLTDAEAAVDAYGYRHAAPAPEPDDGAPVAPPRPAAPGPGAISDDFDGSIVVEYARAARPAALLVVRAGRVAVVRRGYSPDQERDWHGRFGPAGGGPDEPAAAREARDLAGDARNLGTDLGRALSIGQQDWRGRNYDTSGRLVKPYRDANGRPLGARDGAAAKAAGRAIAADLDAAADLLAAGGNAAPLLDRASELVADLADRYSQADSLGATDRLAQAIDALRLPASAAARAAAVARRAYSPDQERDERGRFGHGDGGGKEAEQPERRGADYTAPMREEVGHDWSSGRYDSALDNAIADHLNRGDDEWRHVTVGGREYGRGSTDAREDAKMQVAHDLSGRMEAHGVTVEDCQKFADARDQVVYIGLDGRVGLEKEGAFVDGVATNPYVSEPSPRTMVEPDDPMYPQLLREAVAAELVSTWAGTSNDTDPLACAIQETAVSVFGLTGTTDWDTPMATGNMLESHGALLDAFVRSQYDATQEMLREAGITEVDLSRGMKIDDPDNELHDWVAAMAQEQGQMSGTASGEEVGLRPLSSWSTSPSTAGNFAGEQYGVTLRATVPAERILSTPATGVGCLNEDEVVVIGGGVVQPDVDWTFQDSELQAERDFQAVTEEFAGQPNGEEIQNAYGLDYEVDYDTDEPYTDMTMTNPVTGESYNLTDIDEVEGIAATWTPDPVGSATAAIDELNDSGLLPDGWDVSLDANDGGFGSGFDAHGMDVTVDLSDPDANTGGYSVVSPLQLLEQDPSAGNGVQGGIGGEFNVSPERTADVVAGIETQVVQAEVMSALLAQHQAGDASPRSTDPQPASTGTQVGSILTGGPVDAVVTVRSTVDPGTTNDQAQLAGTGGTIEVLVGMVGGPGKAEVVASIEQSEIYSGSTSLSEFAAQAAAAAAEAVR